MFPGVCHHLPSEPPVPSLDTSVHEYHSLTKAVKVLTSPFFLTWTFSSIIRLFHTCALAADASWRNMPEQNMLILSHLQSFLHSFLPLPFTLVLQKNSEMRPQSKISAQHQDPPLLTSEKILPFLFAPNLHF